MQNRPLTKRQHLFAEAIKAGSNGIEAALKAGFPAAKAEQTARRLGNHPKVIAAIAGLLPSDQFFRPPKEKVAGPKPEKPPTVEYLMTNADLSREWVIDRLMAIAEGRIGYVVVVKERLQALNQLRAFLGPQTIKEPAVIGRPKKVVEEKPEAAAPPAPPSGSLASLFRGTIQAKH